MGNQWLVYFDKYTLHQYGAIASANLVNWADVSDKPGLPKRIRYDTVFIVLKKKLAKLEAVQ